MASNVEECDDRSHLNVGDGNRNSPDVWPSLYVGRVRELNDQRF